MQNTVIFRFYAIHDFWASDTQIKDLKSFKKTSKTSLRKTHTSWSEIAKKVPELGFRICHEMIKNSDWIHECRVMCVHGMASCRHASPRCQNRSLQPAQITVWRTKKANYEERCIGKFGDLRRAADDPGWAQMLWLDPKLTLCIDQWAFSAHPVDVAGAIKDHLTPIYQQTADHLKAGPMTAENQGISKPAVLASLLPKKSNLHQSFPWGLTTNSWIA